MLVPEPAHPDRWYEARVPPLVPVVSERRPRVPRVSVPVPVEVVEEEPVRPAPARTEAGCPDEWADTWLWELCRERRQEMAARGRWLPDI